MRFVHYLKIIFNNKFDWNCVLSLLYSEILNKINNPPYYSQDQFSIDLNNSGFSDFGKKISKFDANDYILFSGACRIYPDAVFSVAKNNDKIIMYKLNATDKNKIYTYF